MDDARGELAFLGSMCVQGLGFALLAGDFIMRLAVNPVVSFLWFIQLILNFMCRIWLIYTT